MPLLTSFSFHAAKSVSLLRTTSRALHLRVSLLLVAEKSSRGILPWDTSASSVEYETLCLLPLASSPERTSTPPTDAATEWTDRVPGLASDLAGDPLQDSLPLPDPELDPDELDELDQLPLDLHPDAKLSPRGGAGLRSLWRGGFGTLMLGGRACCRWRTGGRITQWKHLGVFRDLSRCCGGGGGWKYPRFSDCPASCTADDGLLQNILGLSGTLKRWSVRKIQVVKPQPRLSIGLRRKPANDG